MFELLSKGLCDVLGKYVFKDKKFMDEILGDDYASF